jgi:hypothetical protein
MHRSLTEHRTLLGFQTLAVTWEATGGGVNDFASHSTKLAGMESGRGSTNSAFDVLGSGSTKLKVRTGSPLLPQLPT